MKRLALSLALLLAGLQTAYGQLIWHPNLGTAPSGSVSLAWNDTAYTLVSEEGDEFSSGAAADAINERLSELGIRWIRVLYIDNPATGTYETEFRLDPNTTGSERSVAFGTYASHLLIRQKPQNSYPTVDWPAGRCYRICPGQRAEVTLHDTTLDSTYFVWQTYEDDPDEEMDFFFGTGGDCIYDGIGTPGTYCFDFPNSDFSVRYYDAFSYIYDLSDEVFTASADGGAYRFYMDFYWDGPTRHWIDCTTDLSFLDAPLAAFNGGKVAGWDTHMRISYDYDEEQDRFYLLIVCPPNLGAKSISNRTRLLFDDDMAMEVYQPAGGSVRTLPVVYRYVASMSRVEARIEESQPDVVYTLYCDGKEQSTALGDGGTCCLYAPKAAGYYHVTASYAEGGLSDEKVLEGVRLVGDCMISLSEDRNWIFTQTHNSDGRHAYDLTYYDGLGYAEQEVGVGAVANGAADLVRPVVYDLLRREADKYLPYARPDGGGAFDASAVANQESFYRRRFGLQTQPYAYSRDLYERSPVGRVLESRKAGAEYRDGTHFVRHAYETNGATTVSRLDVDLGSSELHVAGYYGAGMLSVVRTTDEDGAVTVRYTDKEGRPIGEERHLRRTDGTTDRLVTRYVYDACGRLSWVVTPEGTDRLVQGERYAGTSDLARRYCYVYRYDSRGRCVERRLPGRGPDYSVYDRGDRLVMSQDGNLRSKKQWLLYTYDAFGRPASQKLAADTSTADPSERHAAFCAMFDGGTSPSLYTGPSTTLRQWGYDRYDRVDDASLEFEEVEDLTFANGVSLRDTSVCGLPVYEKLAVLSDGGIGGYHERAFYYDSRGREIQRVEKMGPTELLRTTSRYDLAGNVLAQRESYSHDGTTDSLDRLFGYDTRGRLRTERACFNGGERATVRYTYDDLGQLASKIYGTGSHAIHETLSYNLQGWLTRKSSELFEMELRYYDPEPYFGGDASYTGSISEWQWQHKAINGSYDADTNTYVFHYDDLSRLNESRLTYNESEDLTDEFVERDIAYDKNSNILTLKRTSPSEEDDREFEFSYIGNQRDEELVGGLNYVYDANGNMTEDGTNYFVVSYNLLNLPSWIDTYADYTNTYEYLIDGTKIRHEAWDGRDHVYIGSLVYDNGKFESASFGGGRIVGTNNGSSSEVHYFVTDHLGSTRVVAKVTSAGRQDLDRKDYYPFGKEWKQSGMPTSGNRYGFSGKERSDVYLENDYSSIIPLYDFGARFYDPDGVTFLQQDPLLEKYYPIGQYNYCAGNPVRFIDVDGRKIRENSLYLKPYMRSILGKTSTGKMQYDKMVNNKSDISIKRVQGYYVDENGVVDRNRLGNTSLTAIIKDPETGEIIGGKADITLYLEAIKDDAQKRGMRADDREAATLAEEIEHTEAENIQIQLEEQKQEQKAGTAEVISYENKESEQKAHVFRDQVLKESGVEQ